MSAPARLTTITAVLTAAVAGWAIGGYVWAAMGVVSGAAVFVVPWRSQTPWSWVMLWFRRNHPIVLAQPLTVANDRAGGGLRYQDGVAVAVIQLFGKAHAPTFLTGSNTTETENTFDTRILQTMLRQSLGLRIDSLSIVSSGARRRRTGDYSRVYDTLIGTPPYAGRRETWMIVRVAALPNAGSMSGRFSIGSATLAAAQRICAALRQQGIRAKVATATDIVEIERRLGAAALAAPNRRWGSVRTDGGWLTSYGYRPGDITTGALALAWSTGADGVTQNISYFGDGTACATVTLLTPQQPTAAPSVLLRPLCGEQARGIAANLCGPMPVLRGVRRGIPTGPVAVPIGPSGVLLGKAGARNRMTLPLDDPAESSRVHIAAEDSLAKRIVVRLAAAGERVTVHTRDAGRWASVRMPDVMVTDRAKPMSGSTVSVVDGTLTPIPRPNTVVSVGGPDAPHRGAVDVLISQIGPATVEVAARGREYIVEIELFRAENRYVSPEPDFFGADEPALTGS
ncbi:type VII secretion protein EccE [Mycobacterium sp.]|uniref:type VII secretion protein EccE n=1 Tax=Mycobacterium sp. TaxID=1785 RepID=UPI003A852F84